MKLNTKQVDCKSWTTKYSKKFHYASILNDYF